MESGARGKDEVVGWWPCEAPLWRRWRGVPAAGGRGAWVRSRVMVGKGADAESVAREEAKGTSGWPNSGAAAEAEPIIREESLVVLAVPERSMVAAAEVVLAIAAAAGGSGWLWLPS